MRLRMLVCAMLVGLMLSGCIYVKIEGRPSRHWGERMEALEECDRELDECDDDEDEDENEDHDEDDDS